MGSGLRRQEKQAGSQLTPLSACLPLKLKAQGLQLRQGSFQAVLMGSMVIGQPQGDRRHKGTDSLQNIQLLGLKVKEPAEMELTHLLQPGHP